MIALLFTLWGCTVDQGLNRVTDVDGDLDVTITGWACDPASGGWLEGATVSARTLDGSADTVGVSSTTTDVEGRYVLTGLEQDTRYTIIVQDGSVVLEVFDVSTVEDDTVLPQPLCGLAAAPVALVTGSDDWEPTLADLGVQSVDMVDGQSRLELQQFLTSDLEGYGALVFAGGHLEEDIVYSADGSGGELVPTMRDTVRTFVEEGGTLVVSDWAYDVIEAIWPAQVEFIGDDAIPDDAQLGEPAFVSAVPVDVDGIAAVDVHYDADTWPVVESVGPEVEVALRGDAPWRVGLDTGTQADAVLALRFGAGEGEVVFVSWRVEANGEGANEALRVLLAE